MEYFIQTFRSITAAQAAVAIGAALFLYTCYRKIEKYFAEKALRDKEKDDKIQQAIKDLGTGIEAVKKQIEQLREENNETAATSCRYRILRFDDEIRHDERHTKEHFDQILEDITEYEKYCDGHPRYSNNKAVLAIRNIKKTYTKCTENGTFL